MIKKLFWLLALIGILILFSLWVPPLKNYSGQSQLILWQIRLPRILLAILVGASLTLAGSVYQTIFKNPLSEPYLLGVSAGAALGAAFAMITGFNFEFLIFSGVSLAAFLGSLAAIILVYSVNFWSHPVKTERLILVGVGVSAVLTAFLAFLIFISSELRAIYFWLLGSLVNASWTNVAFILCYFIFVFGVIFFASKQLDILRLNDDEAYSLGVNVFQIRLILIFLVTMLVASCVSLTGIIGFIGLLGPHIAKLIFGSKHSRLIPGAILIGAIFLLGADTLSRTLFYPTELPLGIITALIGGPYFLFLLIRRSFKS